MACGAYTSPNAKRAVQAQVGETLLQKTHTQNDTGWTWQRAGEVELAVGEIELAIRVHPRDLSLRRQAARIYVEAGRDDRAVKHLEAAIQLAPRDGGLWIDLAKIERDRENIADAYVAYRRAAALAPTDVRAISGLALSAENLGFFEEASAAYAKWAELKRNSRSEASE